MPRIEYDDEDDFDDLPGERPSWRQRLPTWLLAVVAIGLGFLIPYTLYLNHQVSVRFGQLQWQLHLPQWPAFAGQASLAGSEQLLRLSGSLTAP